MDNYTVNEVEKIIQENLLTNDVLTSIIESSIRRIEIFNDKEGIEILNFLKNDKKISLNIKNDIDKFLNNYQNNLSYISDSYSTSESKSYLFYLIVGILFTILGIILLFLDFN